MAEITSISQVAADVYRINVSVTSLGYLPDPLEYISRPNVSAEILSRAGLDENLTFVNASLNSTRSVGDLHEYSFLVTYDNSPSRANGHQHDHTTLFFPLRESYRDGPTIDLDSNIGSIVISADTSYNESFFRIMRGTTDLLHVQDSGNLRIGGHLELFPDETFDIGTPDEGTLLRRPRDIRLSRDLFIGRDLISDGAASFDEGVEAAYHSFISQPTNPDNDPLARHVYWNTLDNHLHSWDGSTDSVVGGASFPSTGQFTCPGTVQLQDAVKISGSGSVDRADASSSDRVIGFVINKPSALSCVVQFSGEVGGFAGALVPNSKYYLSTLPGQITPNLALLTGNTWSHVIGVSKDPDTLITRFEKPIQI